MSIDSISKLIADSTKRAGSKRFSKIPAVDTRMDHSLTIKVAGKTVGRIQDWVPQQARNVTPIYEVNSAGAGQIMEQVPGIMTGLSINVTRFDLYSKKMEQAWGRDFNITMLCDQTNPLKINEKWLNPDGVIEVWSYFGCWFTSLGRAHSANGDRITRVNATLSYTRKYKIHDIKSEVYDFVDRKIGAFGDKLSNK